MQRRRKARCASVSASRASSPLLFGLAPRGVFRASDVATGAVGSYPTFSPLPNERAFRDVPQVFLRDATVLLSAGGLFSVALSVNRSTGRSTGLKTRHYIRATTPWRYQARCPVSVDRLSRASRTVSGLSSRCGASCEPSSQRSPGSPASYCNVGKNWNPHLVVWRDEKLQCAANEGQQAKGFSRRTGAEQASLKACRYQMSRNG